MAMGEGRPGCRVPIDTIVLLTALRSCNNLQVPFFFFITNIGVLNGDVDGSRCNSLNCSCTNCKAAWAFSWGIVHWSTQTGSLVFQDILSAWSARGAVVSRKKGLLPDPFCLFWVEWQRDEQSLVHFSLCLFQGDALFLALNLWQSHWDYIL